MLLTLTSPSAEAAEQMRKLGVSVLDAAGNVRPLDAILDDFDRGLAGLGGGEKLEVIGRIFDARQAAGFAELLSQGGGRLREFTAALGQAQGVAKRIAGIQLDTLSGDVIILASAFEGLQIAIGEALGGPLRAATQHVTKLVTGLAQWARENRNLVLGLTGIVAGVAAGGIVLVALGTASTVASVAVGGLVKVIGLAGSALALMVKVLAAVLTPMGLVIAATAALGAYLVYASGAGAEALAWLGQRFEQLKESATASFEAIAAALAAGNIALAARVLWLSLKVAWQTGIGQLESLWASATAELVKLAYGGYSGMLAAGELGL